MTKLSNIFLTCLSKISVTVLYRLSTCLYFILFYVIRYRKLVVENNLLITFPEKSKKERQDIAKGFYKNFTDFMVELLKSFSMSEEEYRVHMKFVNMDVLEKCRNEGKDVILLIGHMFNWEWLSGIITDMPQTHKYAVYKKVASNFFDRKVHEARAKFGCIPLSVKEVTREMIKTPNDGSHIFLFVADQSPFVSRIHYELNFFNRLTPVFNGYDKIARRKNYAIVYTDMIKTARGQYEARLKRILPDKEKFEENEIVNKFYKELEENIKLHPSLWLWSHKRWKYTSGIDYQV